MVPSGRALEVSRRGHPAADAVDAAAAPLTAGLALLGVARRAWTVGVVTAVHGWRAVRRVGAVTSATGGGARCQWRRPLPTFTAAASAAPPAMLPRMDPAPMVAAEPVSLVVPGPTGNSSAVGGVGQGYGRRGHIRRRGGALFS